MKITSLLCSFISAALWLTGIYLCIKGVFSTGIPFIIAAILAIPLTNAALSKVIKQDKFRTAIIIGKNTFVLSAVILAVIYLNSQNVTPKDVILTITSLENPMVVESAVSAGNENNSSSTAEHNLIVSSSQKGGQNSYDNSTPIADGLFSAIDKLNKAIDEHSQKGRALLEDMADGTPFPDNNEDNPPDSEDVTDPDVPEKDPSDAENEIHVDGMEVHFLDVGQGDSALILCDNEAVLVDTGADDNGTKIQNYLNKHGVKTLKALILTHPDADHIGSADVLITKFNIENIFMPECENDTKAYRDLTNALDYRGYTPSMPAIGSSHTVGKATYTILGPVKEYEDTNNNSIIFKLQYGSNSFLFTGDAAHDSENDILSTGADITADVLKVGHHGSKYSTSESFVAAISPSYALISCAEENEYYHPHAAALNILRAAGVHLYRTDEQGTVIATCDGKDITFNCAPSDTWESGSH